MEQNVSAEITKEQTYAEIQKKLLSNPEEMELKRLAFEKAFGKDSNTRTRKQWANLVRVYGIETVMLHEGLSEEEIRLKCTETFSQRLARINRIRQTLK